MQILPDKDVIYTGPKNEVFGVESGMSISEVINNILNRLSSDLYGSVYIEGLLKRNIPKEGEIKLLTALDGVIKTVDKLTSDEIPVGSKVIDKSKIKNESISINGKSYIEFTLSKSSNNINITIDDTSFVNTVKNSGGYINSTNLVITGKEKFGKTLIASSKIDGISSISIGYDRFPITLNLTSEVNIEDTQVLMVGNSVVNIDEKSGVINMFSNNMSKTSSMVKTQGELNELIYKDISSNKYNKVINMLTEISKKLGGHDVKISDIKNDLYSLINKLNDNCETSDCFGKFNKKDEK